MRRNPLYIRRMGSPEDASGRSGKTLTENRAGHGIFGENQVFLWVPTVHSGFVCSDEACIGEVTVCNIIGRGRTLRRSLKSVRSCDAREHIQSSSTLQSLCISVKFTRRNIGKFSLQSVTMSLRSLGRVVSLDLLWRSESIRGRQPHLSKMFTVSES